MSDVPERVVAVLTLETGAGEIPIGRVTNQRFVRLAAVAVLMELVAAGDRSSAEFRAAMQTCDRRRLSEALDMLGLGPD